MFGRKIESDAFKISFKNFFIGRWPIQVSPCASKEIPFIIRFKMYTMYTQIHVQFQIDDELFLGI